MGYPKKHRGRRKQGPVFFDLYVFLGNPYYPIYNFIDVIGGI